MGLLLTVFGFGWLWQRKKRLDAEARVEASRLKESIIVANTVRDRLLAESERQEPIIQQLDSQIEKNEQALLNLHKENISELSTDEIRRRLSDLGY